MIRKTRQRTAIADVIKAAGRPLTPQEMLNGARDDLPSLGIATVYRTVNALLGEGLIRAVNIPGQAARYELADLAHHHHFFCKACERVFDIEGCVLRSELKLPEGFKVEGHEITLVGICPSCR